MVKDQITELRKSASFYEIAVGGNEFFHKQYVHQKIIENYAQTKQTDKKIYSAQLKNIQILYR